MISTVAGSFGLDIFQQLLTLFTNRQPADASPKSILSAYVQYQLQIRSIMKLSNILLPLALIASTALGAPALVVERSALEKRGSIFFFDSLGRLGFGQPPNFSASEYPYFCYFSPQGFTIYYHFPPNCGPSTVQNTDPNATVA